MYKISDKTMKFIEDTIENWEMELVARVKSFAAVKI